MDMTIDMTEFFATYYLNAQVNCLLVMDTQGMIQDVNPSFTNHFQYTATDLKGKYFGVLFNEKDRQDKKPEKELEKLGMQGQAHDENYILNKSGKEIWCTGEAILVNSSTSKQYIVKDIINLNSKKELQLFLVETEELLERLFDVSNDIPMMILRWNLKVDKVNRAFLDMFEISSFPEPGIRFIDIDHVFWKSEDTRQSILDVLVSDVALKNREFSFQLKNGVQRFINVNSKIIDPRDSSGKRIFLLFEEI